MHSEDVCLFMHLERVVSVLLRAAFPQFFSNAAVSCLLPRCQGKGVVFRYLFTYCNDYLHRCKWDNVGVFDAF